MNITNIHPYFIYALVLVAYVPGLVAVIRSPKLAAMPVVTFTFLGMLLFTAAGSGLIMTRYVEGPMVNGEWTTIATSPLISGEFVAMLILQALIFYVVVGPYVYLKRQPVIEPILTMPEDIVLRRLLLLGTAVILGIYYAKVGNFLLFDLLAGRINRLNILQFRAQTYGLPEYPFFRLGFLVFPALAAALTVTIASARGRLKMADVLWISLCLIPPLLLAEKAALLHIAAIMFITYSLYLGTRGRSLGSALNGKVILIVAAAFLPTAATYLIYFNTASDSIREIVNQLLFRVIGVYSEALAATVPFLEMHGYLSGATMPNLKGLLPHERFNLEAAMHAFIRGRDVGSGSGIAGTSPVPATGEGYVNFGWVGFVLFSFASFVCVVIIQEILLRLRLGVTSLALSSWYGYLGFTLFTTSLFATFVSLTHTATAIGLVAIWYTMQRFLRSTTCKL